MSPQPHLLAAVLSPLEPLEAQGALGLSLPSRHDQLGQCSVGCGPGLLINK